MNTRLLHLWIKLTSSFWFVPSLMTTAAFGFSFLMIALDEHVESDFISELGWLYTNKPEGAREVLSTIAGSMITVAGVVFSVTIVALSLASSQFGPRLLSNFMRDKGNQVVLGTFISTYFYCLLILRTIRSGDETAFVPHLSVAVGVLFAICSLGVLIYFIHHVAESIQVSSVIGKVATDLSLIIDQQYPAKPAKPKKAHTTTEISFLKHDPAKTKVNAVSSGYLQAIDQRSLVAIADEQNLYVEVCHTVGSFIVCGQPIARVRSEEKCPEKVIEKVLGCFILGSERSIDQDILFPVNQLVEVALRALSPGINDPFTAISCLHRLTAALCEMAARPVPSANCIGKNGAVRARIPRVQFPELLEVSFSQIRIFGKPNPEVMLQLLRCICLINKCIQSPENAKSVSHQAKLIVTDGLENMNDTAMRERFLHQFRLLQLEQGNNE